MLRKSAKRPRPWLLSWANAATKRSRPTVVRVLAFLRMRTITGRDPTSVAPTRASILTSPLATLGRPNRPAAKKGTDVPLAGTDTVRLLANAPVAPRRNTSSPPLLADTLATRTLTVGPVAPDGLVTRIRQGEGAQVRKRASTAALLLTCSSTSIVISLRPRAPDFFYLCSTLPDTLQA